jgi:thymidylate kinase
MDEDQTLAYDMILEGHNICLTGQARTGKSFAIRKAVDELRKRGIRVALTCSTGIGTIVFESLQACTLHKWASLEDGRHDNTDLYHFTFLYMNSTWLNTLPLIINTSSIEKYSAS